jgi:hypothetical protein
MSKFITNGNLETEGFSDWSVESARDLSFTLGFGNGHDLQTAKANAGQPAWYMPSAAVSYFATNGFHTISNCAAFNGFGGSGGKFTLQQAAGVMINGGAATFSGAHTATLATNALVNGLGGSADFGENTLGQGDEIQAVVDLDTIFGPSGIDFFGTTYHNITVDNNGLI